MSSPMVGQELGALAVFAVVAEERSFTRYYASRRHYPPALQALVETLRV